MQNREKEIEFDRTKRYKEIVQARMNSYIVHHSVLITLCIHPLCLSLSCTYSQFPFANVMSFFVRDVHHATHINDGDSRIHVQ